jgi:hypothetical protein
LGIHGVLGGSQLVNKIGVQFHPFAGATKIQFMKGGIASVVRKCVRRGGNIHAFEKAGIGHAVGDHTGGIGFPGRENELLHGTDCFSHRENRWPEPDYHWEPSLWSLDREHPAILPRG